LFWPGAWAGVGFARAGRIGSDHKRVVGDEEVFGEMITPAGDPCRFYYEDFHRGRSTQECRLIARNPESEPWQPSLCASCPVPGILRANASPYLALEGQVVRRFLFFKRVEVFAVCSKHLIEIEDPYIGCPKCRAEAQGAHAVLQGEVKNK
jgi:hypothetical protein